MYLNFVSFLAASLSEYMKLFKTTEPLAHILYEKLNEIVRNVMLKFLQSAVVQSNEGVELVDLKCSDGENWLPLKEVDIAMGTRLALSKVKWTSLWEHVWRCPR